MSIIKRIHQMGKQLGIGDEPDMGNWLQSFVDNAN